MTTYRFPEVTFSANKTGTCAVCGKQATRTRTFMNTVSPFNQNPDGTVRTREEVREKVRSEGLAWAADGPVMHAKCERGQ